MAEILHRETSEVLHSLNAEQVASRSLNGLDLTGADLRKKNLAGFNIASCNLTDAIFDGSKMDKCRMQNCIIRRASFCGTSLIAARIGDTNLDLSDFTGCIATGIHFRHCKINGATFVNANLAESDFSFSEIRSNFHKANLRNANLYGADLSNGDFTYADLEGATMTEAKILRAEFKFAKMVGSVGTNGRTWGASVKAHDPKKPWWKVWGRAAI